LGCLVADVSFLQQKTVRRPLRSTAAEVFTADVAALVQEASAPLAGQSGTAVLEYTALMRYEAQSDAMPVGFAMPFDRSALERDFHARHRQLYGYATDEPAVVESLRVQARVPSGVAGPGPMRGETRRARSRRCSFQGAPDVLTAIVHRDGLGDVVEGPAIIEDAWSTVVVPPGWRARPDGAGHLFLTRRA
jgi:N-methylhydantoinase A